MFSFRLFRRDPEHDISVWADIKAFFSQKQDHRWWVLLASIAMPSLILAGFLTNSGQRKTYIPPDVIYFKNWNAGRTEAEIKAQQAIDAPIEAAERKALADAEAERLAALRRLADSMGINVDK